MKARNFVWAIPMVFIGFISSVVMTLQSCSPEAMRTTSKMNESIDIQYSHQPYMIWGLYGIYGFILFVGALFSILNWYQVKQINKRLDKLGYSI